MDCPNVNWSVYKKLTQQLKDDFGKGLINIGSCGLHIHNAYRAAVTSTQWAIDRFLQCLFTFTLFKDVSARRSDFIQVTESTVFPLKYAPHLWVENHCVLVRACLIIPTLEESKTVPDFKTKSFSFVCIFLEDKLLIPKLLFFIALCKPLEYFLGVYQSDAPMIPFLFKDWKALVFKLMKKFVKPIVLEEQNFLDVDVNNSDNIMGQ